MICLGTALSSLLVVELVKAMLCVLTCISRWHGYSSFSNVIVLVASWFVSALGRLAVVQNKS